MSGDLKELIRAEKAFMAAQSGTEHKLWAGIAHAVTQSIPPRIDIAASALGGGAKASSALGGSKTLSALVANGKLWLAVAAVGGTVGLGTAAGVIIHYRAPAQVSQPSDVAVPPATRLAQGPGSPAAAQEHTDVDELAADEDLGAARSSTGARTAPHRIPGAAASVSTDSFGEELALIRKAQQELASNHPDAALATLREHRRQFGTSQFAEDRSALTALALCASGRLAEGRVQAQRLIHRAPTSIYVDRLHSLCVIPKP